MNLRLRVGCYYAFVRIEPDVDCYLLLDFISQRLEFQRYFCIAEIVD